MLAVKKKDPGLTQTIRRTCMLGITFYVLVYLIMIYHYWQGLGQPLQLWWGLPRDTGWMLYVLSIVPIFFTILYVLKFADWIMTHEDEVTFADILQKGEIDISN